MQPPYQKLQISFTFVSYYTKIDLENSSIVNVKMNSFTDLVKVNRVLKKWTLPGQNNQTRN